MKKIFLLTSIIFLAFSSNIFAQSLAISNAVISQPILCNGVIANDELIVDITQTPTPTLYGCYIGYYFQGTSSFISYLYTATPTTATQLTWNGFNANVDYFIRIVNDPVYLAGNPNGSGSSTNGIYDEWPIAINFSQPPAITSDPTITTDITCNGAGDGSATVVNPSGGTPFSSGSAYTYLWSDGQTTQTANGLSAGSYSCTITDANGCTFPTPSVTIVEPSAITSDPTTMTDITCNGDNDGSATVVNPTGGTSFSGSTLSQPLSWVLTCGGGAFAVQYRVVGVSSWTAIPGNTTFSSPYTLTGLIQNTSYEWRVKCQGTPWPGTTINTFTTGSSYTYLWSDGQTTQTTTNTLSPGSYDCVITDANGCTFTTPSVTIIDPPVLTATIDPTSVNDVSCNGLSDGSATVSASGGAPLPAGAYVYSWSDGQTTQTATGLSVGTYICVITDQNGCDVTTPSVAITEPSIPLTAPTPTNTNVSCNGFSDGSATVSPSGGTPFSSGALYTYLWSDGQTTQTTTNTLSAGSYFCTITDGNGCTFPTPSVTITQPSSSLTASTPTNTNVSCNGGNDGTATVSPSGGTLIPGSSYTYLWSDGQTTQTATGLSVGNYSCTITDANGCTFITPAVTITEPSIALTAPTPTNTNVNCNGGSDGSATVTPIGGTLIPGSSYTYLWSDGQTTQAATGLSAGSYSCTITDANGCTYITTPSVTITEPSIALTAPTPTNTNVNCNGGSDGSATVTPIGGTLLPGSSYTYLWSDGQTTQTATGLSAGSYSCTITDANGCTFTPPSVVITQPLTTLTAITTHINISCNGGSDGSATVTPSGGTPFSSGAPYAYLWSDGQTTQTATGLLAGTYTYTITDAASLACGYTNTVTIIDPPQVIIDTIIVNPITCFGECDASILSVQASGGTPFTVGYSYLYSVNGGMPHPNASYFNGYCADTYTVEVRDANNCYNQEILIIGEPSPLAVDVLPPPNSLWNNYQIRCHGDSLSFADIVVSGGVSPCNITCFDAGGNTMHNSTAYYIDTLFTHIDNLYADTYTFTVTDANGCIYSEAITYNEPDTIRHNFIPTHVTCSGWNNGSLIDSVYGGVGDATTYNYLWNNGETTHTINNIGIGEYILEVRDQNNCLSLDTFVINDNNALSASISGVDVSCYNYCDGEMTINAVGGVSNFNASGTPLYNYQWNDTLFQTTQTAIGLCVNNNSFSTTYQCVVTDMQGCSVTLSDTIIQPTELFVTASIENEISCFNGLTGGLNAIGSGGTVRKVLNWPLTCTTVSEILNWPLTCGGPFFLQYRVLGASSWTSITGNTTSTDTLTGLASYTTYEWRVKCQGTPWAGVTINTFTTDEPFIVQYRVLGAGSWTPIPGITTSSPPYTLDLSFPIGFISDTTYQWRVKCQGTLWAGTTINTFTTPYQYMWSNNAPNYSPNSDNNGVSAGDYVITVMDSEGCTASDFITLNQPTEMSLTVTDTNVTCFGFDDGKIVATAEDGTPFLSIPPEYLYTVINQETGNTVYSTTIPVGLADSLTPGIYKIIAEDRNGCTIESGTIYISEPGDSLSITFNTVDATCLQSNGSASIVAYGGTPSYQYNWDNSVITVNNTSLMAGYYPVTVIDSRGCEIRDSAFVKGTHNVFADSLSEITFNICLGDSVLITINETPFNTYIWENGSIITNRWVYPNDYINIYTLTITDPTCPSSYEVVATVNVDFIDPMPVSNPDVEYGNFPVVLAGDNIDLYSDNNSCVEYTWKWTNDTITDNNGFITISDLEKSDWYYLYVKDSEGCLGYDSIYVVVGVLPYEAITPNNDGFNDSWAPLDIQSYENALVQVFNRWGGIVFESKGGENYQPWDGTNNGEELPVGTYYYIIDLNTDDEPQTGPITIIR